MLLEFYAVRLRDKLRILLWCLRWLFVQQAALRIPDRLVVWRPTTPTDAPKLSGPAPFAERPTDEQLADACAWERHDFGLLSDAHKRSLMFAMREHWQAIWKSCNTPGRGKDFVPHHDETSDESPIARWIAVLQFAVQTRRECHKAYSDFTSAISGHFPSQDERNKELCLRSALGTAERAVMDAAEGLADITPGRIDMAGRQQQGTADET